MNPNDFNPAPDANCQQCGSAWFKLEADPETLTPGVVTIDTSGRITGWGGRVACFECGAPWLAGLSPEPDAPVSELDEWRRRKRK